MSKIKEKIRQCWSGEIEWDCLLKNYTTLKVGGAADALIKPGSLEQLQGLIQSLQKESIPWKVIGRGSNIVVSDKGVDGVVIVFGDQFSAINSSVKMSVQQGHDTGERIYIEAGCSLAKLVAWCKKKSLAGLEFAVGIPGSVGGAIMMNAGAWGHEIKDVLSSVDILTERGQIVTEVPIVGDFTYRKWNRSKGKIIVAATLTLAPSDFVEIAGKCHEYSIKRNESQPKGVASAGSFFKNPQNASAGMLIDKVGLKGKKVGGAQVSEKHANFFINTGQATALDFFELMVIVQQRVFDKFNVELETEVEFIGRK